MKNLVRETIKEIIEESINIDSQDVLYFGKPSESSHVVLKDNSLKKKSIALNNVMPIANTVSNFKIVNGEVTTSTSTVKIPKGDLRIQAFSLYNKSAFNKEHRYSEIIKPLDIAKIMKDQFDFASFRKKYPEHKNFRAEQFPEYSAAKDFLENDIIIKKIQEFNPDIVLFPESSSTFNQILKEMMSEMLPGVEILTTLKQSMLTSFNVDRASYELKRAKLRQSLVDPKEYAKIADPNIKSTGVSSRSALTNPNTEIFNTVEEIIRIAAIQGSAIPTLKIHEINSLSQMQAWRNFISNMHTVCYDKSTFPIQSTITVTGQTIDIPKVMMATAFCYGMVLFYYAANQVNAMHTLVNAGSVENQELVRQGGISMLQDKLRDVNEAQREIKAAINAESDLTKINDLQNQLLILDTQEAEIQKFIADPDVLQANPSQNLSDLKNTIQTIETHVKKVYKGITITKDDLVNIQDAKDLFFLVFKKIIDLVNKGNIFTAELEELFTSPEIKKIMSTLSKAINDDKAGSKFKDQDRYKMLALFNKNSNVIIPMLNRFLANNLAQTIVANMGDITFPIQISTLTSNLSNDPLAIFRNNEIEIEPGVFCKMDNGDLTITGNHFKIEKGNDFEIKIYKYILDKIIVINSRRLEQRIQEKFQDREDTIFRRYIAQSNSQFNVPVMKNILIVDDNIATGATLGIITNEINKLVTQHRQLSFNIEEIKTKGKSSKRSIDRELFNKLEKEGQDIPAMKRSITKSNATKETSGLNIDSLLKNVVCLAPIII